MPTFEHESIIDAPADAVFAYHERPGAFARFTPPWEDVRVTSQRGGISDGGEVELEVGIGPARRRWVARYRNYVAGRQFQDVQVEGPFARWEHTHIVEPAGPRRARMIDHIEYDLPLGPMGRAARVFVRQKLSRVFAYRHRVLAEDLALQLRLEREPMRICITGASGLIGPSLVPLCTTAGHEVQTLTRKEPKEPKEPKDDRQFQWAPSEGRLDPAALAGCDAVVHLAGESIAEGRWTAEKKRRIRESRVKSTRLLAETIASMEAPPQVFVTASAVGYYGDRGGEVLVESDPPGKNFLADVCREWEAATQPAQESCRTAHVRLGVVLSPQGGALKKMLLPFKFGVGGNVGDGKQYWSWIAIDDAAGCFFHAVTNDDVRGPINATAPNPVTNHEFTRTLGKVLNRPTVLTVPALGAKLALGEMADELLLSSARVLPDKTRETGYEFRFPHLEPALRHLLGR